MEQKQALIEAIDLIKVMGNIIRTLDEENAHCEYWLNDGNENGPDYVPAATEIVKALEQDEPGATTVTVDVPPLCMTCGVRDDKSHPSGFCQNDHDDWLETIDVQTENEFFRRALKQSGYSATKFKRMFNDPKNTFINQNTKVT